MMRLPYLTNPTAFQVGYMVPMLGKTEPQGVVHERELGSAQAAQRGDALGPRALHDGGGEFEREAALY